MTTRKLSKKFYQQETEELAKALLGKRLVRVYKGQRISGIITETEAYLGIRDKACHTFGGRKTERTKSMYLEGGHAYVYLIYGMYNCFNVVSKTKEHPEAVLIRSLQPLESVSLMKKFRQQTDERKLTTGPGKLCQALGIDRKLDGESLTGHQIFFEDANDLGVRDLKPTQIVASSRIGVDYAEEAASWPLRFYIKGNRFVSKPS